jgi:hypothetical protein
MRILVFTILVMALSAPSQAAKQTVTTFDPVRVVHDACSESIYLEGFESERKNLIKAGVEEVPSLDELIADTESRPGWKAYLRKIAEATCSCIMKPHLGSIKSARNPALLKKANSRLLAAMEKQPELYVSCSDAAATKYAHLEPQDGEEFYKEVMSECVASAKDTIVLTFQQEGLKQGRAGMATVAEARSILEFSPIWKNYVLPVVDTGCQCMLEPYKQRLTDLGNADDAAKLEKELKNPAGGKQCFEAAMKKFESARQW